MGLSEKERKFLYEIIQHVRFELIGVPRRMVWYGREIEYFTDIGSEKQTGFSTYPGTFNRIIYIRDPFGNGDVGDLVAIDIDDNESVADQVRRYLDDKYPEGQSS